MKHKIVLTNCLKHTGHIVIKAGKLAANKSTVWGIYEPKYLKKLNDKTKVK